MKAWESNIRKVEPYVPGEQPRNADVIKLNTNENPYPTSPDVARALASFPLERLAKYPDPVCFSSPYLRRQSHQSHPEYQLSSSDGVPLPLLSKRQVRSGNSPFSDKQITHADRASPGFPDPPHTYKKYHWI